MIIHNLHFKQYGQNLPLVFFHGFGFDSQIWLPLLPSLPNNFQIICVDLPGFGLSPMMDWPTFKAKLLLQLPAQFVLIGWSMGGLFATRLALEEQERVLGLVNIASSPRWIEDKVWPGVQQTVLDDFYRQMQADPLSCLETFITWQLKEKKSLYQAGARPSLEGLFSGLEILQTWDLREGLKTLTRPCCYIFGRLDSITPVKIMSHLQLIYPDFHYVLMKQAAHVPFLSHSDLFVAELLQWLQQHELTTEVDSA
jgi:pimeloyl-[acyl-carrier protein] methyl ester esterase